MPNEKAILTISTRGEISIEVVDEKDDFLRVMQQAVGGRVQTVPGIGRLSRIFGQLNLIMICNEDVMGQALECNLLAGSISGYEPLFGPVAIVQRIRTEDGELDLAPFSIDEAVRLYRRGLLMTFEMEG